MKTLDWFREIGPVTRTRYPELHVWRQDRGLWRILAGSGGDVDVTGPPYASKAEALSDLEATAARWGYTELPSR